MAAVAVSTCSGAWCNLILYLLCNLQELRFHFHCVLCIDPHQLLVCHSSNNAAMDTCILPTLSQFVTFRIDRIWQVLFLQVLLFESPTVLNGIGRYPNILRTHNRRNYFSTEWLMYVFEIHIT